MQSYSSEDDNKNSTSVPVGGTAEDANPGTAPVVLARHPGVPGRYPGVPARADSTVVLTSSASVVPARGADWNPVLYSLNGPWMRIMALG